VVGEGLAGFGRIKREARANLQIALRLGLTDAPCAEVLDITD
jgi:hypothetical protein